MKKEVPLPFRSGFYLQPNSLVTQDGSCMPMFGRSRDTYTYVMALAEVDAVDYLPLDDNIVVMKNDDMTKLMVEGSAGYYTMEPTKLVPFHKISRMAKKDYMLFAVKATNLFHRESTDETLIARNSKLYFLDTHFPSREEPPTEFAPSEPSNAGIAGDIKVVADSIRMQQKRSKTATNTSVMYDTGRANKIMKAIKGDK